MREVEVVNETRGRGLGRRVRVADGFWTRLRGLLGRPPLEAGAGLLITPSRGVHTLGMRYVLDVLLLDGANRVVAVYPELGPWRRTRLHRRARHALEFPKGTIDRTGTREGDVVTW